MKWISRVFDENLQDSETYYDNSFTWELNEKLEIDFTLSNSVKVIGLQTVDRIQMIIVETDNPLDISISTATENIKLGMEKTFVYTPTQSQQEDITEFAIEENNGLECSVKVRIYGKVQES